MCEVEDKVAPEMRVSIRIRSECEGYLIYLFWISGRMLTRSTRPRYDVQPKQRETNAASTLFTAEFGEKSCLRVLHFTVVVPKLRCTKVFVAAMFVYKRVCGRTSDVQTWCSYCLFAGVPLCGRRGRSGLLQVRQLRI